MDCSSGPGLRNAATLGDVDVHHALGCSRHLELHDRAMGLISLLVEVDGQFQNPHHEVRMKGNIKLLPQMVQQLGRSGSWTRKKPLTATNSRRISVVVEICVVTIIRTGMHTAVAAFKSLISEVLLPRIFASFF